MKQVKELRLKQVLANLFNLEIEQINGDTSIDTVENWDSLKQLKLVIALEEEFEIEFIEEEVIEIVSYPLIKETLKEHGIELI